MDEEQIKDRVILLSQMKKRIEQRTAEQRNDLTEELCPKGKKECEPSYCTFRLTDTCPFLDIWRKILAEADGVPNEKHQQMLDNIEELVEKNILEDA